MDAEQLDKFDECRRGCCFLWLFDGEVRFTFLVDCQKEFFFFWKIEETLSLLNICQAPGLALAVCLSLSHLSLLRLLDNIIPILHLRQMRLGEFKSLASRSTATKNPEYSLGG